MQEKKITKAAVIKAAVFCLFIFIITQYLTSLVVPKFLLETSDWPSTSTFSQFYYMDKNSVDVLFLGSSSMASAGNPQHLYNTDQIVSYNLSSPEQTLITSYYWLKEALRFQNPKVVFLDNQMLFTYYEDEELNFKEPGQRKDFDYMKWSKVKMEAVHDFCSLDSDQSEISYYIPIIRYHDRWKELGKIDFSYETSKLYGYAPLYGSLHDENEAEFVPIQNAITDTQESDEYILPLMQEYMDKIVTLCNENNITLVLLSTPSPVQTQARHNLTAQYADANNLTYIDFNTMDYYTAANLNYLSDCFDTRHMTIPGSEKVTDYLGDYLCTKQMVQPKDCSTLNSTQEYYQEVLAGFYGPDKQDEKED